MEFRWLCKKQTRPLRTQASAKAQKDEEDELRRVSAEEGVWLREENEKGSQLSGIPEFYFLTGFSSTIPDMMYRQQVSLCLLQLL